MLLWSFREESTHLLLANVLMACNCFPFKKVQPFCNGPEISVAFLDIGVSSCQMGGDKAEAGVMVV